MSSITAFEDLQEDLILLDQPENRRNEIVGTLIEAIKEGLDYFSYASSKRQKINLYPCEVIAVQHFLTQFGFHLKRIHSDYDKIAPKHTYKVIPNWL